VDPHYLLDTNIISELVRNPQGELSAKLTHIGEKKVCTSIIVSAELRFGAEKSGSHRLIERVNLILSAIIVLPLDEPADKAYAVLRRHLEQCGTPIGPNDMLIAAHAISRDLIVVTANEKEFRRVPDLRVENWLA
jgi:tRNA(fMet)-specific endonuclease VapC